MQRIVRLTGRRLPFDNGSHRLVSDALGTGAAG